MAQNGRGISPKKTKAIGALLEHSTITAAAEAAGIGHRTLTRWLKEDHEFKRALADAQTRALDQTISRLSAGAPLAAEVLIDIATNEYAKPSVRVQAASRILSELRAGLESVTLKKELEEIRGVVDDIEKRSK